MTTDNPPSSLKLWITVVLAFVVCLALMVLCAYVWVFIYASVINSGGNEQFYTDYAQRASPVVAVIVAFPIFFAMARYMRRFGSKATFAAFAVVGLSLGADLLSVFTMAQDLGYHGLMSVVSTVAKIAGAWFGSRSNAEPRTTT